MLYTQVHCINIAFVTMLVNIDQDQMKLVHMYYLHVIRFTVYNVLCIINFYRLQGHPYDCFPQGLMYNYIISAQTKRGKNVLFQYTTKFTETIIILV